MGVPKSTDGVIKLLETLDKKYSNNDWPLLIHCTAGIGRTGTFMSIHLLTEIADKSNHVLDIKSLIFFLRHQRISLVETWVSALFLLINETPRLVKTKLISKEQFKFIFQTLYDKYKHMVQTDTEYMIENTN